MPKGIAPRPGGWAEAKRQELPTYFGQPCATCESEIRITATGACWACKQKRLELIKQIAEKTKAERDARHKARKEQSAQRERNRIERKAEALANPKPPPIPRVPVAVAMRGVNYGGDPDLGLNDNTYPDEWPYNTSLTKEPISRYQGSIGCAAAQCADFGGL